MSAALRRPARGVGEASGFTLVELLTVISVIAILAGIALPNFRSAVARADAARVVSDVRMVRLVAAQYASQHDALPAGTGWGEVPPDFRAMLPDGFSFAYKGVEYAWAVVDAGSGGSAALPEGVVRVWGYALADAPPVPQGKGKGKGKGAGGGGGEDAGPGGPGAGGEDPGAGDPGGGAGPGPTDPAPELTGRIGVMWVRYSASDPIAAALQRHAGTWAFWTETQMMFVLVG